MFLKNSFLDNIDQLARKSHQELSWDLDLSDNIIGFNNLYKTDKEVP